MTRSISVGIDVGTSQVKVVVVEYLEKNEKNPKDKTRVIGTGIFESKGMEHGFVKNAKEVSSSVNSAIKAAEKAAGVKISRVYLSISGVGLLSHILHGGLNITKSDNEITTSDLNRVLENARTEVPDSISQNRKILHAYPLQYKIDGKTVLGHPEGLKGNKLEVKILAISTLTHHLNDLINAVEDTGVKVDDIIAGPIVSGVNIVSKAEKKAGVIIADIGAETLSLTVYEDNVPLSLEVQALGSNNITNDLALGLKISLEEAEQVKLGGKPGLYPKKKIDEIINARLSDIFEVIENHLKKISKSGLLPAGIIILGGGSKLPGIENIARNTLKLPSRKIEDRTEWSVAYGTAIYGIFPEDDQFPQDENMQTHGSNIMEKAMHWVKQFLP